MGVLILKYRWMEERNSFEPESMISMKTVLWTGTEAGTTWRRMDEASESDTGKLRLTAYPQYHESQHSDNMATVEQKRKQRTCPVVRMLQDTNCYRAASTQSWITILPILDWIPRAYKSVWRCSALPRQVYKSTGKDTQQTYIVHGDDLYRLASGQIVDSSAFVSLVHRDATGHESCTSRAPLPEQSELEDSLEGAEAVRWQE